MREWQTVIFPELEFNETARKQAEELTSRGIVEIVELKAGVQITTNSYVGTVMLGDFSVNITPKLSGIELFTLMQYAYGLHQVKLFHQSTYQLEKYSFMDILILQVYLQTEELMAKGFYRGYVREESDLSTPRGRLDVSKLATHQALKKTTLPSVYYDRQENHLLNQVVLAGLHLSVQLVQDPMLKIKLQRLSAYLQEHVSSIKLNRHLIQKATIQINRLTEKYRRLIELIALLYDAKGVDWEGGENDVSLQGFFFDMNLFFEQLLFKLIDDYVPGYSVKGQFQLHEMFRYTPGYNPQRRKSPTPRPDFALVQQNKVVKLLDAKYKDLWEMPLPINMLYQLAIYALSRKTDKTATIIYPAQNKAATTQKIDIQNPANNEKMATVILAPVNLGLIAHYLTNREVYRLELMEYIGSIVFGEQVAFNLLKK